MAISEKIMFDKTEIIFVDLSGKKAQALNLTYEKIISVRFDKTKVKSLFSSKDSERISITVRGKEQPLVLLQVKEKPDYWQGYKDGLTKFCKDNRISFYNELAG
jgi:hypothetical protein